MPIIEARGLTRTFRRYRSRPGVWGAVRDLFGREYTTVTAVDHIDLTVEPGEMVGYIGANGAGKSTTIKMLAGILVPTAGHLRVCGMVPWQERERFVRRIGVVFGQRTSLWWDIAVRETFRLLQRIYRIPDAAFRAQLNELVEMLDIGNLLSVPVRKLSLGQRMRCELAAALLHRPELVFLDEPTIGLDVVVKLRVREFLQELNRRHGTTVILTTHDLGDIEALCPRVVVLHQGRVHFDGPLAALKRQGARGRALRVAFAVPVDAGRLQAALAGLPVSRVEQVDEATCRVVIPAEDLPVAEVLARAMPLAPLTDVAVEEPSMEEIVRELYQAAGVAD